MSSCRKRHRLLACTLLSFAGAAADPQAGLYGNTVICIDHAGRDIGHLWVNPDGGFVLATPGSLGAVGRMVPEAVRDDGAVPVCLQLATAGPSWPSGWPAPTDQALTTQRLVGPASCWVLGPHFVGDRWPLSGENVPAGVALLLVAGRR